MTSKRYGADQRDRGAKKRAQRHTFKVILNECGHQRTTWKIRLPYGVMCMECNTRRQILAVRMGGQWVTLSEARQRIPGKRNATKPKPTMIVDENNHSE